MKAMLCEDLYETNLPLALDGDEWAASPKIDGMRVIASIREDGVRLYNRNGERFQQSFADIIRTELLQLPPGTILDGEVLGGTEYWLFDILHRPGKDLTGTPYSERAEMLDRLWHLWSPLSVHLVPVVWTPHGKRQLLDRVTTEGGEGLVFKRIDSQYEAGVRSRWWVKHKLWKTADVLVHEISPTGKRSISVALLHEGGDWPGTVVGQLDDGRQVVDVGNVLVRERLLELLHPGQVVEVRYLYLGEGEKLYSPSFLRIRTDKKMDECTTSQIKRVNRRAVLSPS